MRSATYYLSAGNYPISPNRDLEPGSQISGISHRIQPSSPRDAGQGLAKYLYSSSNMLREELARSYQA